MDLRRADIGLLISLDALLAEQSVTTAARRLGLSQPALSAQLSRLRLLFRDDLLVGNAHGMVLTPRAQELKLPLRALLEEMRALVFDSGEFDPSRDERTFRIAASDLAHSVLLPALFAATSKAAAMVTIEARPLDLRRVAEAMEHGSIDMAITSGSNAPLGYPARKLVEQSFRVIWRENHPKLGSTMSIDEFCSADHLLATLDGGGVLDDVDDSLKTMGLKRKVVGSVPNFLLTPMIVRATDCVAVIPSVLADVAREGIRSVPVPIQVSGFAVYLSWHPRMKSDAAHRWMRELVAKEFAR